MKYYLVAIRDTKTKAYMPPSISQHPAAALRQFGDLCKDKTHEIGKHASDYELHLLAEWDDQDGRFVNVPEKEVLGHGEYLKD